jgi:transcriptional regulator with XRE-family HTH domain
MEEHIGDLLKYYRGRAGLSQDELAEAARMSRNSIYNYETGKQVPPKARLEDIIEVLKRELPSLDGNKLIAVADKDRMHRRRSWLGDEPEEEVPVQPDTLTPDPDENAAGSLSPSPEAPSTPILSPPAPDETSQPITEAGDTPKRRFTFLPGLLKDTKYKRYIGVIFVLLVFLFLNRTTIRSLLPCRSWNLTSDAQAFSNGKTLSDYFSGHSYGVNPFGDACGNSDTWSFMRLSKNPDKPGLYLLNIYEEVAIGSIGLIQWQSGDESNNEIPAIGINTTNEEKRPVRDAGLKWLAKTIRVHPSVDQEAVIGWRSPIHGIIRISGSLEKLDPKCGDGILWYINLNSTNLAKGNLPKAGERDFSSGEINGGLRNVPVNRGDFIYFIVDSGADEHCDSTSLNIEIANITR